MNLYINHKMLFQSNIIHLDIHIYLSNDLIIFHSHIMYNLLLNQNIKYMETNILYIRYFPHLFNLSKTQIYKSNKNFSLSKLYNQLNNQYIPNKQYYFHIKNNLYLSKHINFHLKLYNQKHYKQHRYPIKQNMFNMYNYILYILYLFH